MAFYALIGLIAVAGTIALGVNWILQNVTIKKDKGDEEA